MARELGPAERGIYAACLGLLTIAPVVIGVGVPLAVRRFAAQGSGEDAVRTMYRLLPLLVLPMVAVGFLVLPWLIPELSGWARTWFYVGMGVAGVQAVALCVQSVLIVRHNYLGVALTLATLNTVIAFGTVIAWLLDRLTLTTLLALSSLGGVLMACVAILFARIGLRGTLTPIGRLYAAGTKYAGSQVAEVGSNTIVQILAVGFIGAQATGYFAIAMTIAGLPLVFAYSIGVVAYKAVAVAEGNDQIALMERVYRIAFAVGVLGALSLSAFIPWVIPLFFGSEYVPSVLPALVLLIGSMLIVPNYVASQLLAATGRGWAMTTSQFAGLACAALVTVVAGTFWSFAPVVGALVAAFAVVSSRIATFVASLVALPFPNRNCFPRFRDFCAVPRVILRGRLD